MLSKSNKAFVVLFLLFELALIIIYGVLTEFNSHSGVDSSLPTEELKDDVQQVYPFFQDVHVMIFVGFGFLMTFLKHHSWTSVGFNYLIAAFAIQLAIPVLGFFLQLTSDNKYWEKVQLTIHSLVDGDFAAGAVLISFGAILGKCNALQLLVLATIEIVFYSLNASICVNQLEAVDVGGSMYVHTFGAYFGIAASLAMTPRPAHSDPKNTSGYFSNLFAMIGTLFLWMYWPSFNGALVTGN